MKKNLILIFLSSLFTACLLYGFFILVPDALFPFDKARFNTSDTAKITKTLPPETKHKENSPEATCNQLWRLEQDIRGIPPRGELIIQAVGDILLARDVGLRIRQNGWKHPFESVRQLVAQGDINFCNLETPASFIGSPYPGKHPNITFRAQPGSLFSLKYAGFNIISLANNHMTDHGPAALEETLDALQLLDLYYVGAGRNYTEAYAPAFFEKNGWRIAFLAYADPIWSVVEAQSTAGVAHIREDVIIESIQKLRKDKTVDAILVSLHWGEEYRHSPLPKQRTLAKHIIDAGADAIIGHHPHVMQGVEWYRGKPILYSLGNFAFDQIDDPTYQSTIARLSFSPEGHITLSMRPMRIARRSLHQTIPQGEDLEMISKNIITYNKQLGSTSSLIEDGWIHVRSSTAPDIAPESRSDSSSIP